MTKKIKVEAIKLDTRTDCSWQHIEDLDGLSIECSYCQECCDHEYDSSEGMMCINCNKEYPY